jgi:dihydrofolate reductase
MIISAIVAASENQVIGINNKLPWHMPADMKYFKATTLGKPVVMGRKTFESLGKPLPGRPNIVITRQPDYQPEGVFVVDSVEAAIVKANSFEGEEFFITGGTEIFKQSLPLIQRIYLTRIHTVVEGDAHFPVIHEPEWTLVKEDSHLPDEKNRFPYSFQVWERRQ